MSTSCPMTPGMQFPLFSKCLETLSGVVLTHQVKHRSIKGEQNKYLIRSREREKKETIEEEELRTKMEGRWQGKCRQA